MLALMKSARITPTYLSKDACQGVGEGFHSVLLLAQGEGWLKEEDLLRRPYLFAPKNTAARVLH